MTKNGAENGSGSGIEVGHSAARTGNGASSTAMVTITKTYPKRMAIVTGAARGMYDSNSCGEAAN